MLIFKIIFEYPTWKNQIMKIKLYKFIPDYRIKYNMRNTYKFSEYNFLISSLTFLELLST